MGGGEHACSTYADEDAWPAILGDYFARGLAANEQLVFVAPSPDERLRWALPALPFEGLVREGRLLVASTAESFLPNGTFDPDALLAASAAQVQGALAAGFSGIRGVSDVTTVLTDPVAKSEWHAYELRADLLATRLPLTALCVYDERACSAADLDVALAVHGHRHGHGRRREPGFRLHAGRDCFVLSGEIDVTCSQTVRSLLARSACDLDSLRLDVTDVSFIDAAGIAALIQVADDLDALFAEMTIHGASPRFRRIWSLLELDRLPQIRLSADVHGSPS